MGSRKEYADPFLHKALAVTWLAYAYFYVLRKTLGCVKGTLKEDRGYSEGELAMLDSVYLAAYSVGCYASGCLVDIVAPRIVLSVGLALAAVACAAMPTLLPGGRDGAPAGLLAWLPAYLCWFVHGLAQSTGHPAIQRALSRRLQGNPHSGFYLAIWTTSQATGGMLGNCLGGQLLPLGWASVFALPAVGAPVIFMAFGSAWHVLEVPLGDRGRPASASHGAHRPAKAAAQSASGSRDRWVAALGGYLGGFRPTGIGANPKVLIAAMSAFFVKFVRYALLLWLPYYYWKVLGMDAAHAVYWACLFEIGGFLGILVLGRASDKIASSGVSRRAAPAAATLFIGSILLGVICPVLQAQGPSSNQVLMALCMLMIGICVDGAESVITGTLCTDLCENLGLQSSLGQVVGLVNGTGILGALISGPVVTRWAAWMGGWSAVFPLLGIVCLACSLALLPLCAPRARLPL